MNTVIIAVERNTVTAIIERIDNIETPHIPWPAVHPDIMAVPTPTRNAALLPTFSNLCKLNSVSCYEI